MPEPARRCPTDVGYYVYGVVPRGRGRVPTTCRGSTTRRCELVEVDGIAAAVGEVALDRPPGRRADLMAHSKVVDALADSGVVVPVQFGSVLRRPRQRASRSSWQPTESTSPSCSSDLDGTARSSTCGRRTTRSRCSPRWCREDPTIADLRRRTRDLPPRTRAPRSGPARRARVSPRWSASAARRRRPDPRRRCARTSLDHVDRAGGGVDHSSTSRSSSTTTDRASSRTRSRGSPRRCTSGSGCA